MQETEWNKNTEKVVEQIRDISRRNKDLHIREANKSRNVYNILTIAGMIVGPATGILAGSKEVICETTDSATNGAIVGLSIVSSLIMSVIKFGNFDEMHHLHKQAASDYHMIENNASLQLLLDKHKRLKPEEYVKWLHAKYEDVFEKSPLLPYTKTYTEKVGVEDNIDLVVLSESDNDESTGSIKLDNNVIRYEIDRLQRL